MHCRNDAFLAVKLRQHRLFCLRRLVTADLPCVFLVGIEGERCPVAEQLNSVLLVEDRNDAAVVVKAYLKQVAFKHCFIAVNSLVLAVGNIGGRKRQSITFISYLSFFICLILLYIMISII